MSVQVIWQPSSDPLIASYRIERAPSIGGPWSLLVNIAHNELGPNWDPINTYFFYNDAAGTSSTYYRITSVDQGDQAGPSSPPFTSTVQLGTGVAALVNLISIPVGNASTLLGLGYSTIEVYESLDDGGTYNEVTASDFLPALVSSVGKNTYGVGGFTLVFKVNGGSSISVDFDPILPRWTPQQVADRVNQVAPGAASVVGGAVVLSSVTTGRTSSIEVVSSPGDLSFPPGRVVGKDARLQLAEDVQVYLYYDVAGTPRSRYKWRFSDNGSNPISSFATYAFGKPLPVAGMDVSVAMARFIGPDGSPQKRSVIVALDEAQTLSGFTMVDHHPVVVVSDDNGFWQMPLVQGARVRVAIEGSDIVRTITVPNTTSFDLMTALSDAPDGFNIQTVAPLLTRRNI